MIASSKLVNLRESLLLDSSNVEQVCKDNDICVAFAQNLLQDHTVAILDGKVYIKTGEMGRQVHDEDALFETIHVLHGKMEKYKKQVRHLKKDVQRIRKLLISEKRERNEAIDALYEHVKLVTGLNW